MKSRTSKPRPRPSRLPAIAPNPNPTQHHERAALALCDALEAMRAALAAHGPRCTCGGCEAIADAVGTVRIHRDLLGSFITTPAVLRRWYPGCPAGETLALHLERRSAERQ